MTNPVRITNLSIKVHNFDDLDKVFGKVDEINKKHEESQYSHGISVSIEVDLINYPSSL